MEAAMPNVDQETQKIISTYQQIYNLIFKYGVFIVMGIVSFALVLFLESQAPVNAREFGELLAENTGDDTIATSGNAYIAKGVSLFPKINTEPIEVSILQGFVDVSKDTQMGYGALATHKGIILPISINLTYHENNFSKAYFSSGSYEPSDLDVYIKNNVLTYPVKNIQNTLYQYKKESIDEQTMPDDMNLGEFFGEEFIASLNAAAAAEQEITNSDKKFLTNRFGLKCLGNRHLTDFFCYKNTEMFASRIPELMLQDHIEELSLLMTDIVQTPYKDKACNNLEHAFSKIAEGTREWEMIFSACGGSYLQAYRRIVDFATVTYELKGISNAKVYADDDINMFKLVSLQQKIYHNTLQKNYDVGTIEAYLMFLQDLLVRRQSIPQMYKDMIYLYNNTYLKDALTQIAILNNNTKAMLRLTDVVRNINEGTIQLQKMVSNPALLAFVDASQGEGTSQQNLVTFQDLFSNKFTTFDNFIVTNQRVDNDTLSAQVEGYFMVNTEGVPKKVLFIGNYLFKDENFVLTSAAFPQSPYLESTLNKLILDHNNNEYATEIDIPFVFEFIRNNNNYASLSVSVCDIITSRVNVTSCDEKKAIYDDDTIRVIIALDGYRITSVNTSDATITQKLRDSLQGVITTQSNIGTIVNELIKAARPDLKPGDASDLGTGSNVDTNQFIIISKFKQFLDITPTNIKADGEKYLIEFKLGSIKFVGVMDIKNNYKLFPLAVQKVNGEFVKINNLSFNLINASLSEINLFKTDPWAYIKKLDPAGYESAYPTEKK